MPADGATGGADAAVRWVVLLRGVNVGGVTVRSADLKACVEALGYTGVRTVLASGNVLLDAPPGVGRADVKARLERGLRETFGYDAWVVVVTKDELAAVVAAFPWPSRDGWHDYVTFVSDAAVLAELAEQVEALGLDPGTDPVAVGEGPVGVVCWQVEKGRTLDAPFPRLSSRPRHRSTTTTRNLRTLRRLLS